MDIFFYKRYQLDIVSKTETNKLSGPNIAMVIASVDNIKSVSWQEIPVVVVLSDSGSEP